MPLTVEQCIEILKKPTEGLDRAVYHEDRVRLHTEPTIDEPKDNQAFGLFLKKAEQRIPDDAFDRFKSLIDFPFPTVDFTEDVFNGFNRVFESPERYVNITFTNADYQEDFKSIQHKTDQWFKNHGINTLKTKFNSFIVVDVPPIQEGPRPEPYFYVLNVKHVRNVDISKENHCKYISFDTGKKQKDKVCFAFFDDQYYRMFIEDGGKYRLALREDGTPMEVKHGLGWCPVSPFWSDVLDPEKTMLLKKMPATNAIGRLDTLAFKVIGKEYSDLYNMYPILWSLPEAEDQTRLDQTGPINEADLVEYPLQKRVSNANRIRSNPGRFLEKPMPNSQDGDPGDPVGFVGPPVENLEFIMKDLEVRKKEIKAAISGSGGEPENDQAKNKDQIRSGFESEYAVFLNLAVNFARIEAWVLKTQAALRYRESDIKEVSVNNGKNFFLHTYYEILDEIERSKKVQMPSYIIDQQERAFIQNKYRSNPQKSERMEIIRILFPYSDLGVDQIIANAASLNPDKVIIRINFNDLLNDFETKFGPIEGFMPDIDFKDRVKKIKEEFTVLIKSNNYGTIRPPVEGTTGK